MRNSINVHGACRGCQRKLNNPINRKTPRQAQEVAQKMVQDMNMTPEVREVLFFGPTI